MTEKITNVKFKTRFRTSYNRIPSHKNEGGGISLTDQSCDIPIERLISKLANGEPVYGTGLKPYYDITDPEMPLDEQFKTMDPTLKDGFSMADAHEILDRGRKAKRTLSRIKHHKLTSEQAKKGSSEPVKGANQPGPVPEVPPK
ncbi:MAG: hypothetical protein [Arizlama microvirus]|nr:MAG: hypothetical protein [Arizlama microvirus]